MMEEATGRAGGALHDDGREYSAGTDRFCGRSDHGPTLGIEQDCEQCDCSRWIFQGLNRRPSKIVAHFECAWCGNPLETGDLRPVRGDQA